MMMMMMMTTTTLHHALHLQADIDRLYFKRSEGGRGLMSVEDSANSEINRLSRYVEGCNGSLLEAVYKEEVLRCYAKSCEAESLQQERKERFQGKQLHREFWRNMLVRDKKTWKWLIKGRLKKETEGLIIAAKDQALWTNSIKRIIGKMCLQSVECAEKVMRQLAILYGNARNLLKSNLYWCWRHNKVAQVIHWGLCEKLGYDRDEKYYNHEPQPVYESSTEQAAVRLQNTDWKQDWT